MPKLSDLIITVAYFSIPLQIVWSLARHPHLTRQVASNAVIGLLVMFALFIFCCGLGHMIRCMGMGDTELFRIINDITAAVSLFTALYLLPIIPTLFRSVNRSLHKLKRSRSIVKSLYPANFRERMSAHFEAARATEATSAPSSLLGEKSGLFDGAPIAEVVPQSHIMFSDITGFTSWSSRHSPTEVFMLLETLFWQFDQLVEHYGVFKLGTIGDCFIAATGIIPKKGRRGTSPGRSSNDSPLEPNDEEECDAVIMAQFTEHCRQTMHQLFQTNNNYTFDFDTSELSMRFGIHCGEVTAGVLRGTKSRFELFGDTINVASRMESLGEANRIHISPAVAEALVQAGRKDWITPRRNPVYAKGKGEMATYWLEPSFEHIEDDSEDTGDTTTSEGKAAGVDIEQPPEMAPFPRSIDYMS